MERFPAADEQCTLADDPTAAVDALRRVPLAVPTFSMIEPTSWRCRDLLADCPPGRLDLALPHRGIVIPWTSGEAEDGDHDGRAPGTQILGIGWGLPDSRLNPVEHWARGPDLTGVYELGDPRALRVTATWRRRRTGGRNPDSDTSIWELVLSTQTSVLESSPSITVVSRIPRGTIAVGDRGGRSTETSDVLVETEADTTVLVAVHPIDAAGIDDDSRDGSEVLRIDPITADGHGVTVTCRLFARRLEKGVLLRGRVLAAIGRGRGNPAWVSRELEAFRKEPPPLAT